MLLCMACTSLFAKGNYMFLAIVQFLRTVFFLNDRNEKWMGNQRLNDLVNALDIELSQTVELSRLNKGFL